MNTQKIIIDTDPGVDDAMAIFYAFLQPKLEVIGLTTVFGNVSVDVATRNALVLAELAGRDVPVARGAEKPLVMAPNPHSSQVHGVEGFGDMAPRTPKGKVIAETAAEFIVRQINENPGEITLCPIGPLTNIALALEMDPSIAQKTRSVVIMGGGMELGNVTEHAEANIWNDPHAADRVFAAGWEVVMVGLDVTRQITCGAPEFSRTKKAAPVLGGFLSEATAFYLEFYQTVLGEPVCRLHDPSATIAISHPELFTIENHALEVIVEGTEIGKTIRSGKGGRRAVKICMGVDAGAVKELFLSTMETGF